MLLNKLLKAIQPVQVTGESDIEITGINIDSRLVEAGQLFMAMRGTQADGHAYIPTAIEKGAVAVLCEDMPEEPVAGITYIQVKDSEEAVGKIERLPQLSMATRLPKWNWSASREQMEKRQLPPYYIIHSATSDIKWD
jgi:UDP-N-acetylmuramyl pentapeptide synthase